MKRIAVTFFALAAIVAVTIGLAAAPALADAPSEPAKAASSAPVAAPCAANVKAVLDVAFPRNTSATCVGTRPSEASQAYEIDAQVSLADSRLAHVELVQNGREVRIARVAYEHGDITGSTSKPMALVFWLFAAGSIGGALFVITRRNLIAAVMGMVGSFLGIAAVYMLLYAQFLAVIQMLVYAGAIMVLFVFVVMILNRPEDEPVAPSGRAGQAVGALAILYLVGRLVIMLTHVQPPDERIARDAPPPLAPQCVEWTNGACSRAETPEWGSISAVGADLFGPGLFPFEAISILLLIAVVGAIAIARPLHSEDDAPAKARQEGVA